MDTDGIEEFYGPISSNCEQDQNELNVFPNPASHSFTVEIFTAESAENSQLEILNYSGKTILLVDIELKNGTQKLNFSSLPKGIYLIRVTNTELNFNTKKIVIQ